MPPDIQQLFRKAFALHQQGKFVDAQALYEKVLSLDQNHVYALHFLGVVACQRGQLNRSVELITRAIAINASIAEAHNSLGNALQELRRFDSALVSYGKAISLKPDLAEAHNNRGLVLRELKRLDEALASYDEAVALKPNYFQAHFNRGVVLQELERDDDALGCYDKAIALRADYHEAYVNRALLLQKLHRLDAALANYDKVILLKPDLAGAHHNRGNVLKGLGHLDAALASYDRAIALNPQHAAAHNNRGNILQELRRLSAAIDSYNKAIVLKPDYVQAYINRGVALQDLRRLDVALSSYDRALSLDPRHAQAHYHRGNVLRELGRNEEALASYDSALALDPSISFLRGNRLHTRMLSCDWRQWRSETKELLAELKAGQKASPPLAVLAIPSSRELQLGTARVWAFDRYPSNGDLPAVARGAKRGRIRVGYFSSDFRRHPVAQLIVELIERHDRSCVEAIGFSTSIRSDDEIHRRLVSAFDSFIDIYNQSDKEAALLARRHKVDIAVDLNGYTQGMRTGIFALRAAPLQVNFLGYPGTMGSDYIDYLIADPILIPKDHQNDYSEKIVYLPNSYQPNDTTRRIADRTFTRAELGLPLTGFVFCCFNNSIKITPEVFDCWMRVLKRVPKSVLWLLKDNEAVVENLRREASQRGVAAERLVFAERMALPEHLARHRLADLFLDTLPYNAHTTASDALWAGLPVLTQLGETFAGRVAASLLNAIGLPELVTLTEQAYEELAVELTTNSTKYKDLRSKLADNRLTTSLFDIERYVRHIEAAYAVMYDRHQADLAPDHIYIS